MLIALCLQSGQESEQVCSTLMRHENSWKIEEEVSINKRQDKSDSAGAAIAGLVKFKN